jgi:hypothetical protein
MVNRMRRIPLWLVLVGGAIVVIGVPIQAFTIAAYVRGWVNGLHGFLALVILLAGVWYATRARRELGRVASALAATST